MGGVVPLELLQLGIIVWLAWKWLSTAAQVQDERKEKEEMQQIATSLKVENARLNGQIDAMQGRATRPRMASDGN